MNVLDHIEALFPEIKLIILSHLHPGVILDLDIDENISEDLFKLISPEYYIKVKNIVKLNKTLGFPEYKSEGPYFWHILLKDELYHHISTYYKYDNYVDYIAWDGYFQHMNIISINIRILIKMYELYPNYYKYLKSMVKNQQSLYLLYESIGKTYKHSFFNDIINKLQTEELYKYDGKLNMKMNGECELLVYYVVLIYFLRQFMDRNNLIYLNEEIENALFYIEEEISDESDGSLYVTKLEFEKHGDLMGKYLRFILHFIY